jgi:hypothetical protein
MSDLSLIMNIDLIPGSSVIAVAVNGPQTQIFTQDHQFVMVHEILNNLSKYYFQTYIFGTSITNLKGFLSNNYIGSFSSSTLFYSKICSFNEYGPLCLPCGPGEISTPGGQECNICGE